MDNEKDMSFLNVFKAKNSSHEQIKESGERLMLIIYSAPVTADSLDELRYLGYKKQLSQKSLTAGSGFDFKSLPQLLTLLSTTDTELIIMSINSLAIQKFPQ